MKKACTHFLALAQHSTLLHAVGGAERGTGRPPRRSPGTKGLLVAPSGSQDDEETLSLEVGFSTPGRDGVDRAPHNWGGGVRKGAPLTGPSINCYEL